MISNNKSNQKFGKKIHVILQTIFYEELNDAIFKRLGINYLQVNNKRTLATIYIDIENIDKTKNIMHKLNLLKSFLRKRLSEELKVYKPPFLKFVEDKNFKQALKVEELINKGLLT